MNAPKSIIYGLLALAIIGGVGWTVHKLLDGARQEAIQDVERANRANEGKAAEGQSDVDACYRNGGTWDRAGGVCKHASGG